MSVTKLKEELTKRKVNFSGLVEKSEFKNELKKSVGISGGYLNNWFHHCY
jgi:hypothetical protein